MELLTELIYYIKNQNTNVIWIRNKLEILNILAVGNTQPIYIYIMCLHNNAHK